MPEITELDMNKYLVLKWDDINKLSRNKKIELGRIINAVSNNRSFENKKDNNYLVLNLDDEIHLSNIIESFVWIKRKLFLKSLGAAKRFDGDVKVSDIAVALVNAILKAKEK